MIPLIARLTKGLRHCISHLICKVAVTLLRRVTARSLPTTPEEWRYCEISFSQFGEDILILRALESASFSGHGIYVDVGAFDPIVYSNTLRLHLAGWQGINIDPDPKHILRFDRLRPKAHNVCLAIANGERMEEFLVYSAGTTSQLASCAIDGRSLLKEQPVGKILVPVRPLAAVLKDFLVDPSRFAVLSVDTEGGDLAVLQSNDWAHFRPYVIAVEDHTQSADSEIDAFCRAQEYRLFARCGVTKVFIKSR